MRLDIAAQTDIGRRKKTNEDCYAIFREDTPGILLFDEGALLCVADGLGGHTAGEIASKLAVTTMKDMLKEAPPPPPPEDPDQDTVFPIMRKWFAKANENIYKTNEDLVKAGRPMGTTLLTVLLTADKARIVNVGDSRCYHIRNGELIEKTEDHSWVDEQVKLGLMSRAEAESDARRSLVTRSIGTHPEVGVDAYVWHTVPGDWLLLCTDGLVNMVKETDIRDAFKEPRSAAEIAQHLVNLANENGGKDNITVIIANISPSVPRLLAMRARAFFRSKGARALRLIAVLLFGAVCFAAGYFVHGLLTKSP